MIAVGHNTDAWCSRCGFILAHTIEAMVGSHIARVHCNTCGAQHGYRPEPPGQGSPAPRRSGPSEATASRTGLARASHYQTVMENRDPGTATRYSPKAKYKDFDLVEHVQFGLGVVTGHKSAEKIEVLFPGGAKVLVHGRK